MNRHLITRTGALFAMVLVLWSPIISQSTSPSGGKVVDSEMMKHCQAMMDQKQKMMSEMKAQDADLMAEIGKMNQASDKKKLDMLAAVVTHMMEHRLSMSEKMEQMQEGTMKHMMQHMQMGHESMGMCPMMIGMKDMDGKPSDLHKGLQMGTK